VTQEYLSPEEVATVTGKSRQTIYNWIKSGDLPAVKKRGTWLVRRKDIE
jgi:excisionase family DNA binding protein